MAKAFEAKYPGIKVRTFSSRGSQMPARIITEAAAGKLSVDVGTCAGLDELLPLLERDLIASYDWTKISDLNPEDMLFDGRLIPHHDAPMVWVYNPTLVAKKDIPRSWDDLLDPMWKGSKISIRTNANNLAGLYPAWQKDPEKVIQYLGQLRKQEIMPAPGGVMGASRVATGETPIGVVRSVLVPVFERKGTPLPLSPIGPAVASPFAFYTPKAKGVPHPNAARLFIGWTHTKEGMAAFVKAGRGPGAPCDASTVAKLLCDNGIEFIRINKTIEGIKEFRKFVGEAAKAMGWK
jgi:iron(III) transport system substrate-binding protein